MLCYECMRSVIYRDHLCKGCYAREERDLRLAERKAEDSLMISQMTTGAQLFRGLETTEQKLERLAESYLDAHAWRSEEADLLARLEKRVEALERREEQLEKRQRENGHKPDLIRAALNEKALPQRDIFPKR